MSAYRAINQAAATVYENSLDNELVIVPGLGTLAELQCEAGAELWADHNDIRLNFTFGGSAEVWHPHMLDAGKMPPATAGRFIVLPVNGCWVLRRVDAERFRAER